VRPPSKVYTGRGRVCVAGEHRPRGHGV